MAHSYTPGLRVTEHAIIRRERRLPLKGDVLVERGARVRATDPVARTLIPGNVQTVNVANALGCEPIDVPKALSKGVGDPCAKGDVLARRKGMFGLMESKVSSPAAGVLESCSEITGQVILREPPLPVEVDAYLDGIVAEVLPGEGVIVEAPAAFVQGIFGIGGETNGELALGVSRADEELTADKLTPALAGKIVIAGRYVSYAVLKQAVAIGVRAVVVGGFDDRDLREIMGYDLGVAITGQENIGLTLILPEGFGHMPMADRTFRLLSSLVGKSASVSGATQIRAGVQRPEIVIPVDAASAPGEGDRRSMGLEIGSLIRGIREPFFGRIGTVVELPPELTALETEAHVRVLAAEFEGKRAVLPRANVELIES
jgi:hypothetical protein